MSEAVDAKKVNQLAAIGLATINTACDMTHYWRCDAWIDENGKRYTSHPWPVSEKCTCGLSRLTQLINRYLED